MQKKLTTIIVAAVLSTILFSACNKSTTPTATTPATSWNWSGTAPFSAKIDGAAFDTDTSTLQVVSSLGYVNIVVYDKADEVSLGLSIQSNAVAGNEYTMPSPNNLTYTNQNAGMQYIASSGKCKIISISANSIEGYFYSDMKDPTGNDPKIPKVTEGYFNVSW